MTNINEYKKYIIILTIIVIIILVIVCKNKKNETPKEKKKYIGCSMLNNAMVTKITNNKILTKYFLKNYDIPTPEGFELQAEHYPTITLLNELIKTNNLSFPLVLKRAYGMQGKGVYTNITDVYELRGLINKNNKWGVLIEEQLDSPVYRVLYVNGKLFDIVYRIKPYIKGDGRTSLDDLINNKFNGAKHRPNINYNFIKAQHVSNDTIIKKGQKIYITDIINSHNGATSYSFNINTLHPDNRTTLDNMIKMLNSKCAGIDIMSPDLTIPFHKNNGKIIEINSKPGIQAHTTLNKTFKKRFVAEIKKTH